VALRTDYRTFTKLMLEDLFENRKQRNKEGKKTRRKKHLTGLF
jgi:hypothetical protein